MVDHTESNQSIYSDSKFAILGFIARWTLHLEVVKIYHQTGKNAQKAQTLIIYTKQRTFTNKTPNKT